MVAASFLAQVLFAGTVFAAERTHELQRRQYQGAACTTDDVCFQKCRKPNVHAHGVTIPKPKQVVNEAIRKYGDYHCVFMPKLGRKGCDCAVTSDDIAIKVCTYWIENDADTFGEGSTFAYEELDLKANPPFLDCHWCYKGKTFDKHLKLCIPDCPSGQVFEIKMLKCITDCPNGGTYDPKEYVCKGGKGDGDDCPKGQSKDPKTGACTSDCPKDQTRDSKTGACVGHECPKGQTYDKGKGECTCPDGQKWDTDKLVCVKDKNQKRQFQGKSCKSDDSCKTSCKLWNVRAHTPDISAPQQVVNEAIRRFGDAHCEPQVDKNGKPILDPNGASVLGCNCAVTSDDQGKGVCNYWIANDPTTFPKGSVLLEAHLLYDDNGNGGELECLFKFSFVQPPPPGNQPPGPSPGPSPSPPGTPPGQGGPSPGTPPGKKDKDKSKDKNKKGHKRAVAHRNRL